VAPADDSSRALGSYWSAVSLKTIRYRLSAGLALTCALALGGCESNDSTAAATPAPSPTPAPAPAPAPAPGPSFTVSGTIFETAPTVSTRVGEAEVQLSGGVATGSIADGTFTIPNVANGTYTLRIAKAGYETHTGSVTVTGANVAGIAVNLLPVFRWVDREFTAELKEGDPPCAGTSKPCRSYVFGAHHAGDVRAFTAWSVFGAFDWNTLVTQDNGFYEPGLFDIRGPEPRPTAAARLVSQLAAGGTPDDPTLESPGWWQRPERVLYPRFVHRQARAAIA